ncbi:hypothetical protein BJ684DRAFT_18577, partial [Piptocephalis cylindrospora]
MESYKQRLARFEEILSTEDLDRPRHHHTLAEAEAEAAAASIDMYEFRELCFRGIPDKPGIRPLCWKLLLNYLPPDKRQWSRILREQRDTYYSFVKDLIVLPGVPTEKELTERAQQPLDPAMIAYHRD